MTTELSEKIAAVLPSMPLEVLESWLVPHARRSGFGWPPPADGTAAPWSTVLGGRPLSWLQAQHWVRENLPMDVELMSHAVQFHVGALLKAASEGRDHLPGSQGRLADLAQYIENAGTWPVAPVGFPDSVGLGLIDGFHRLAALEAARQRSTTSVADRHAIWIAVPASGELG